MRGHRSGGGSGSGSGGGTTTPRSHHSTPRGGNGGGSGLVRAVPITASSTSTALRASPPTIIPPLPLHQQRTVPASQLSSQQQQPLSSSRSVAAQQPPHQQLTTTGDYAPPVDPSDPRTWTWQYILRSAKEGGQSAVRDIPANSNDGNGIYDTNDGYDNGGNDKNASSSYMSPADNDPRVATLHSLLPLISRSERAELRQLRDGFDYFVQRLEAHPLRNAPMDADSSVDRLLSIAKEEQGIYDLFFQELSRQVGVQCKERGEFLIRLRDQYAAMFQRVPQQVQQLQTSYITQRQLTSNLAAELQSLQDNHFQVKVELSGWQQRLKESDHELESCRDLLQRSEREREKLQTMLNQLTIETDRERVSMEAELVELREQREDWQAAATATADALARAAQPGDATSIEIQSLPLHQDGAHALDANGMNEWHTTTSSGTNVVVHSPTPLAATRTTRDTGTSPLPDTGRQSVESATSPTVPPRVLHPAPPTGLDKETAARIRAHLAQGHQPPSSGTLAPPLGRNSSLLRHLRTASAPNAATLSVTVSSALLSSTGSATSTLAPSSISGNAGNGGNMSVVIQTGTSSSSPPVSPALLALTHGDIGYSGLVDPESSQMSSLHRGTSMKLAAATPEAERRRRLNQIAQERDAKRDQEHAAKFPVAAAIGRIKSALPHLSDQIIADAVAKHNGNVEATLSYLASDAANEAIAKMGGPSATGSSGSNATVITSTSTDAIGMLSASNSNRHVRSDSAMDRIMAGIVDMDRSRSTTPNNGNYNSGELSPNAITPRRASVEPTMGTVDETKATDGDGTTPTATTATDTNDSETTTTSVPARTASRAASRNAARHARKKSAGAAAAGGRHSRSQSGSRSNGGGGTGSPTRSGSNSRGHSATRRAAAAAIGTQGQTSPPQRTGSRVNPLVLPTNPTLNRDASTTEFTDTELTDGANTARSEFSDSGNVTDRHSRPHSRSSHHGSRPGSAATTPSGTHRPLPPNRVTRRPSGTIAATTGPGSAGGSRPRTGGQRLVSGQSTLGGGVVASSGFSTTRHQRVLGPDPSDDDMAPWAPSTTTSTTGSGTTPVPTRPNHPVAATPAAANTAGMSAAAIAFAAATGLTPTDDNKYPTASDGHATVPQQPAHLVPKPRRRPSVELEPDEAFIMKEQDSDSSDDDMRAHARRLAAMVKSLRPGSANRPGTGHGASNTANTTSGNRAGTGSSHGYGPATGRDSTSRLAATVLGAAGADVPGSEQWQWRHGRSSSMPIMEDDAMMAAALALQRQQQQAAAAAAASASPHGSPVDAMPTIPRFPNAEAAHAAMIAARTQAAEMSAAAAAAAAANTGGGQTPPTKLRQRSLRAAGSNHNNDEKEHDPDGIAAPNSNNMIHSSTSSGGTTVTLQPRPPSVPRMMDEKQIDAMLGIDGYGVASATATSSTATAKMSPRLMLDAPLPPLRLQAIMPRDPSSPPTERELELEYLVADLMAQNDSLLTARDLPSISISRANSPPPQLHIDPQPLMNEPPAGLDRLSPRARQQVLLERIHRTLSHDDDVRRRDAVTATAEWRRATDAAAGPTSRRAAIGAHGLLLESSRFLNLLKAATMASADGPEAKMRLQLAQQANGTNGDTVVISLTHLIKWIRSLYDAKTHADDVARMERVGIRPLPEFVYEAQRKKYGLASIVEQKSTMLLKAIERYRHKHTEVDAFAQFLEESRSLDELILFLRTRAVVRAVTIGIRWPGHIHDRGGKNPTEYISLDRARAAVAIVFGSAPSMADKINTQLQTQSLLWTDIPDPIPPQRWEQLLAGSYRVPGAVVDTRCVPLYLFLDNMLTHFRSIELELRHNEWAARLFSSVERNPDQTLGFEGFSRIFANAQPAYTKRQIAQMYANLVRTSGTAGNLALPAFQTVIHQLMTSGIVFPLIGHSTWKNDEIVRSVLRHWSGFQKFYGTLLTHLRGSDRKHDMAAAASLEDIRFLIDKEGSGAQQAARLVCLYRGLLHVILSHQAAFMLNAVPVRLATLNTELKALEHIIMARHATLPPPGTVTPSSTDKNNGTPKAIATASAAAASSYSRDLWLEHFGGGSGAPPSSAITPRHAAAVAAAKMNVASSSSSSSTVLPSLTISTTNAAGTSQPLVLL